jgi:hypothetical protein
MLSCRYAKSLNLDIWNEPEHCGSFQFADGSYQKTLGQVHTFWTFASGERIPITFEVLENCCSDIIIGEDILWDYNVFEAHSSSIISVLGTDEQPHLAPFGYEQGWQNLFGFKSKAKSTVPEKQNLDTYTKSATDRVVLSPSVLSQQAEERRRHLWWYKYGIDGAKASAEEQNAERARRDRYNELSQQKPLPLIKTAPTPPRPSDPGATQKRGIVAWLRQKRS